MRLRVAVDVLLDARARAADSASRVLEGTVDDGRRTGSQQMAVDLVAGNPTRRIAPVGAGDRVTGALVVMTLK